MQQKTQAVCETFVKKLLVLLITTTKTRNKWTWRSYRHFIHHGVYNVRIHYTKYSEL